jgi:hypothetical protein
MKSAHTTYRRLGAVLCAVLSAVALAQAQTNVVTNGSFESGLTGWTFAKDPSSPAGTCGFNVAAPAPGTETTTSTSGFPATDGVNIALGGGTQTGTSPSAQFSCTLYQDVAIPANATTANFNIDTGIKYIGGKSASNAAIFWGLYSTASVPAYSSSRVKTFNPAVYEPSSSNTALQNFPATNVNVSSIAGQTVRLAVIIGSDSTTGAAVIGVDNVQLVTVAAPATVPALGVWGMFGLGGLLLLCGWWRLRRRQDVAAA